MSTIEAIGGIRGDIVGPRPVAPEHSLLNTPGVLQARDIRVFNGVDLIGYPDETPSLWADCQEGTFDIKGEGSARPQERFDPFAVYIPVTCSTYGQSELPDMAREVLQATESHGVERALAEGINGLDNPYFGDAGRVLPAGGTAVSPRVAFAYLEQSIGATGRQGMIHATPAVVAAHPHFVFEDHENLVTGNGTPVVSGTGYQGVDTIQLPGVTTTTQDWVFATGPVQVWLGPVVLQDLMSSLDRSDNTVTYRAERYVLAIWDAVVQAAVLVDWST